jgi:hypothetical protein
LSIEVLPGVYAHFSTLTFIIDLKSFIALLASVFTIAFTAISCAGFADVIWENNEKSISTSRFALIFLDVIERQITNALGWLTVLSDWFEVWLICRFIRVLFATQTGSCDEWCVTFGAISVAEELIVEGDEGQLCAPTHVKVYTVWMNIHPHGAFRGKTPE